MRRAVVENITYYILAIIITISVAIMLYTMLKPKGVNHQNFKSICSLGGNLSGSIPLPPDADFSSCDALIVFGISSENIRKLKHYKGRVIFYLSALNDSNIDTFKEEFFAVANKTFLVAEKGLIDTNPFYVERNGDTYIFVNTKEVRVTGTQPYFYIGKYDSTCQLLLNGKPLVRDVVILNNTFIISSAKSCNFTIEMLNTNLVIKGDLYFTSDKTFDSLLLYKNVNYPAFVYVYYGNQKLPYLLLKDNILFVNNLEPEKEKEVLKFLQLS